MKKTVALLLGLVMVLALFAGCGTPTTDQPSGGESVPPSEAPVEKGVINLYTFTVEVQQMIERYMELHPEFPWTLNATVVSTTDNLYEPALDEALNAGGSVDMYCAESAFVLKYAQGDMSSYAMPYEELGIDVAGETAAAQIAQYTIDIGTRPSDGKLVALGYQATGGAMIYRRSLAKATWGTEDPAEVAKKVGPGWEKFFTAAADLKAKGYAIVSGDGDIWHSIENSSDSGWLNADGKLVIDPKREAFLDLSKQLKDGGYHNDTQDWSEAWYADMQGIGTQPVFCFFGPAWLINYVMGGHSGAEFDADGKFVAPGGTWGDWAVCDPPVGFFWGGTWLFANNELADDSAKKEAVKTLIDWITLQCDESSLQYGWANGTTYGEGGTKDTVASGTVMAMSNGELDFLGGQNMFDVFVPANKFANGKNLTQYDGTINSIWREHVRQYTSGNETRDEAIAAFKQAVKDQLGIDAA